MESHDLPASEAVFPSRVTRRGPSDSSDSGSDRSGIAEADSDAVSTGELRDADAPGLEPDATDTSVDRVIETRGEAIDGSLDPAASAAPPPEPREPDELDLPVEPDQRDGPTEPAEPDESTVAVPMGKSA